MGRRNLAALATGVVMAAAGCASFTEQPPPQSWQPQVQLTPQGGPEPREQGEGGGGGGAGERERPESIPPPDGCTDFDPAVLATCLDSPVAVAAMPGDGSDPTALVGERTTGRILLVRQGAAPRLIAKVAVDAAADGGLTGLALSPSYAEDRLVFAYITTPTDNRLVRIAPGDVAKPVLTGIPRGASGNRGALALDHRGALLLATGSAGKPADPKSLAGKLLRLDAAGKPHPDNPDPRSPIVAAGLTAPGGVCAALDGSRTWVTDRTAAADVVHQVQYGKPLGTPAWTWRDKPGVAGCATTSQALWIAMSTAGHLQNLPHAPDGTFTGKPQVTMDKADGYGRIAGMDLVNDSVAVAGTVNKRGGKPVSSDDRAIVIIPQGQAGSGRD
ncbi:PQQ-dependent sugar dehydrogenase [Actinokineospora sp. NPDC004072]